MTREEAIKELEEIAEMTIWNYRRLAVNIAIEALSEPKTGRWTWDDKGYFRCDQCGEKPNDQTRVTDFCPNCGADMRGE